VCHVRRNVVLEVVEDPDNPVVPDKFELQENVSLLRYEIVPGSFAAVFSHMLSFMCGSSCVGSRNARLHMSIVVKGFLNKGRIF